ncbi:MAG: hypothetical protein QM604_08770 [Microbacterium sp.]
MSDEYDGFHKRRQARMRLIAWVVIVVLVLVGGGATAFALLFN